MRSFLAPCLASKCRGAQHAPRAARWRASRRGARKGALPRASRTVPRQPAARCAAQPRRAAAARPPGRRRTRPAACRPAARRRSAVKQRAGAREGASSEVRDAVACCARAADRTVYAGKSSSTCCVGTPSPSSPCCAALPCAAVALTVSEASSGSRHGWSNRRCTAASALAAASASPVITVHCARRGVRGESRAGKQLGTSVQVAAWRPRARLLQRKDGASLVAHQVHEAEAAFPELRREHAGRRRRGFVSALVHTAATRHLPPPAAPGARR